MQHTWKANLFKPMWESFTFSTKNLFDPCIHVMVIMALDLLNTFILMFFWSFFATIISPKLFTNNDLISMSSLILDEMPSLLSFCFLLPFFPYVNIVWPIFLQLLHLIRFLNSIYSLSCFFMDFTFISVFYLNSSHLMRRMSCPF